jgi:phosphatidylethanolamine-binding protein (PEBP) family uncharacterized protein
VEQRKGADGRLAPAAKAASARGIPALAVAVALALALAGCGGDSGGDDGGPAPAGAEGSAAVSPDNPSSGESPEGSADPAGAKSAGTGAEGEGARSQGAGAEQGGAVAVPQGPPESGPTPEQLEKAKVADIALESPAVLPVANGPAELPAPYTCEGKDSWPALRWRAVPEGTAELVLFAMALAPVEGKIFFDWAVAGIDPALEGLEAGRLPAGAVAGRNSFGQNGYSVCPPPGQGETYFFVLYALPQELSARPGFDPHALRKRVQGLSRNVGLLPVSYTR